MTDALLEAAEDAAIASAFEEIKRRCQNALDMDTALSLSALCPHCAAPMRGGRDSYNGHVRFGCTICDFGVMQ